MEEAELIALAGQLLGGATAFAGLLLVFMGAVSNGYESYHPADRSSVRTKYRQRAYLTLIGFLCSLASAAAALSGSVLAEKLLVGGSIVFLAAAAILVTIAACQMVGDIN